MVSGGDENYPLKELNNMSDTVCDMIGCNKCSYGSIQLGPGTLLDLCKEHLEELKDELGREDLGFTF